MIINFPGPTSEIEAETEGVIKFDLHHRKAPAPEHDYLQVLNAWRSILFELGLTGQDSTRYGGLGYGNVSIRTGASKFIISGSQTGGIPVLEPSHYVLVTQADPLENRLESEGPIFPSSEAMTHAAAYLACPWIQCVLHVHHPRIWNQSEHLGIPATSSEVAYGTVAMANAIGRLCEESHGPVIAMKGHTDGLIAVGRNIEESAHALIDLLAKTLSLQDPVHPHQG